MDTSAGVIRERVEQSSWFDPVLLELQVKSRSAFSFLVNSYVSGEVQAVLSRYSVFNPVRVGLVSVWMKT